MVWISGSCARTPNMSTLTLHKTKEKFNMNKKLIVLAVAGALAAPLTASAQSNSSVTIFGRVQAEYSGVQIDQTSVGSADRRQKGIAENAGQSRFGFDVKEDLGGGLNANARVEFAFRTGNGVADTAREQWVGLSSKSWGAAKFGRVQSVLKDFAGGAGLDPFGATHLQARGSGGALYVPANGFGAGGHVDHAIRYDSPTFGGGFSAAVLWMPSDADQAQGVAAPATTNNAAGNTGGKGGANDFQLGLKYKFGTAGEIFGGYSVDKASDGQAGITTNGLLGDDEKVWRIGGSWTFGAFKIAAQYDDIENALGGNGGSTCGGGGSANGGTGETGITTTQCLTSLNTNGDGNIFFLTGQYKMGNTTFVLQGGRTEADAIAAAPERRAKNLTVGAIHNLSKRSSIFGGFQRVSVDGASAVGTLGVTGAAIAIQPDRSVWSLGVRHNF